VRAIAGRLSDAIKGGDNLSDAIQRESASFPPLFLAMAKVGESTGNIAEIFGELEKYFELELQLRRQFRSQTFLPIVQFVFAVALIAGVIYILGILGGPRFFTIFGLSGGAGSLAFLGAVFGTLFGVWLLFFLVSRLGRQTAWLHGLLLNLPAVGPCVRALTMSRFTLALQMTLDSGLPITKALKLSFDATGNAYFASRSAGVVQSLKGGHSLYESLRGCQLFDDDFLEMVVASEESGSVPEMMRRLALQYQEETARKLKLATRFAAGALAFGVAAFIIWAIFRFANVYLGLLNA
jgi:type II secretory pathway component PulF